MPGKNTLPSGRPAGRSLIADLTDRGHLQTIGPAYARDSGSAR